MARFARRVRRRLGLTQVEFARRIDVSPETVRNWEQGKRGPTGAATLLHSRLGARNRLAGADLRGGPSGRGGLDLPECCRFSLTPRIGLDLTPHFRG